MLVQLFRIIVSALFLFSGISKILSLVFFDGLIAELFIGDDYYNHPSAFLWTQFFTRLVISGEIVLGIAIMQPKWLKTVVLPAIMILLVGFTVHLTYMGFERGFIGGNCGCFGDLVPMDNFESILKNVITMALVVYIWLKYDESKRYFVFKPVAVPFLVGIVSLGTLALSMKDYSIDASSMSIEEFQFESDEEVADQPEQSSNADTTVVDSSGINEPQEAEEVDEDKKGGGAPEMSMPTGDHANNSSEAKSFEEPKDEIVTIPKVDEVAKVKSALSEYTAFSDGNVVSLDDGNKLVCMFSLTCGHCQQAYKDLCAISSHPKLPPVYLILYGSDSDLNYFFSQAGCKHPYVLINDYVQFARLLEGRDFPRLDARVNGKNVKTWDLESYNIDKLKAHYGITSKPKSKTNEIQLDGGTGLW